MVIGSRGRALSVLVLPIGEVVLELGLFRVLEVSVLWEVCRYVCVCVCGG